MITKKLALMLALALAAMAVMSAQAVAQTVTPAGDFRASGSGILDSDSAFVPTIDCATVTARGNTQEDGTGSATATFDNCTVNGDTCVITDADFAYTIDEAGTPTTFTITIDVHSTILCTEDDGTVVVQCAVWITAAGTAATDGGGTITDGDNPSFTLEATVRTDTGLCTGSLSGTATVDAIGTAINTNGDEDDTNTTENTNTGVTSKGTGNDLTITA